MRFNIRIDSIWRAGLILGGATSQNSYVILGDDGMHFRLGLLFNRTVPYDQVAAAFPRSWPFLYGIGCRPNFRGVIGLTGSYHDVVEVRMKQRIGNWLGVFPCDRIAVSLEEPEAFIAELSARTGLAEPPDINALSRPTRRPSRPAKRTADSGPSTAGRQPTAKAAATKAASAKTNGSKAASEKANATKVAAPAKPAAATRAPAAPNGTAKSARPRKPKAPAAKAAKPASATSSGRAKATRLATPKSQANAQPKAAAAPHRAPAAKTPAPKRAVRKVAPSRTAVRARRSRGS